MTMLSILHQEEHVAVEKHFIDQRAQEHGVLSSPRAFMIQAFFLYVCTNVDIGVRACASMRTCVHVCLCTQSVRHEERSSHG